MFWVFLMSILTTSSIMMASSISLINMIPAILVMTSTMMLIKWMETSNPWLPLIFVLAFLGGMMIMFMYVVSIVSKSPKKIFSYTPLLILVVIFLSTPLKTFTTMIPIKMFMVESLSVFMIICLILVTSLIVTCKVIGSPFKALSASF